MVITRYLEPGLLIDADLELILDYFQTGDNGLLAPCYRFRMAHHESHVSMGNISLRVGNQPNIVLYAGHIGYGVDEPYRGRRYAARSVKLILPLARRHGIDPVWITCNPDNWPSRRTCELAGGEFVEIVDLPPNSPMYMIGERQKCRYRFSKK